MADSSHPIGVADEASGFAAGSCAAEGCEVRFVALLRADRALVSRAGARAVVLRVLRADLRVAVFFAVLLPALDLRAGAFLALVFLAVVFFAPRFAAARFGAARRVVVRLAVVRRAAVLVVAFLFVVVFFATLLVFAPVFLRAPRVARFAMASAPV
ncbi:MAG TPA: hypothetical protein VFQ27_02540 [Xanthobacteraceae bacterium]|nr:hypothetical protein [Xanthobacteraceae bacterium]